MSKLFELGNRYAKESNWTDFALVKFCLCAMGILIGMRIPSKRKTMVTAVSASVFIAAYVPLMAKLFKIALREEAPAEQMTD